MPHKVSHPYNRPETGYEREAHAVRIPNIAVCFHAVVRKRGDDAETARRTLHRLAQEEYAVIYVTEQLAQDMTAEIARYKDDMLPAVILIPGRGGALGLADRALHAAVERAVGADIS